MGGTVLAFGGAHLAFTDFGMRNNVIVPMLNQLGGSSFDTRMLMETPDKAFPTAWKGIQAVATGVVQPLAMTVLAIILMFSLLNASTRIDADGKLGIRIVLSTLFKAMICIVFTEQASTLGTLATSIVSDLMGGLSKQLKLTGSTLYHGSGSQGLGDYLKPAIQEDLGTCIGILLSICLPVMIVTIAGIAVKAIIYLRFIQIYIYTACSGLGIAFLGSQYTRSWGESYIRSFLSVIFKCFTLYLSLYLYTLAAGNALNVSQYNANHILTANGSWLNGVWLSVLLLAGCIMAGNRTADAIFGR